jgi:PAS domain S-box-containing protein
VSSTVGVRNQSLFFGEDRFRSLVEAVQDYAIFMLDEQGYILSWNSGAERIKGYEAAEIIGKHFSILYPEEDVRGGKPHRLLEIARKEGRLEDEGWRVRKDGSRFWADVVITSLLDAEGNVRGFAKVTRDLSERRRAEETLRQSIEQRETEMERRVRAELSAREAEASVRELSLRLLRLQEDERRRLGRELHDSVGQLLVAAKLALGALDGQASPPTAREAIIAECNQCLEAALREVRTVSYLLYPPMLEEMGLRTAIEWLLEGFRQRSGIEVKLEFVPEVGTLARDTELALFRVLQESLTNVHRHSGSATAQVRLALEGQNIVLEIKDQGKGTKGSVLDLSGDSVCSLGVGLRGMYERMRQINGRLEFFSSDEGTTVRATAPLQSGKDVNRSAAASGA